MKIVTCYVCGVQRPETLAHEHHITPQAAGGEDGPKAWLCADDHNGAHRIAEKLASHQVGLALDLAQQLRPDPAQRSRLLQLANVVAEEMTNPKGRRAKARVTIELDHGVYADLKIRARERHMAVATYIVGVLSTHVKGDRIPDQNGEKPHKQACSVPSHLKGIVSS